MGIFLKVNLKFGIKDINNDNENYQNCITERKNNEKGFIEKLIEKYNN